MKNAYCIKGNVTEIYCNKNGNILTVLIDTDSLDKVSIINGSWFIYESSSKNLYVAYRRKENKKIVDRGLMHRIIKDAKVDELIDHINCNGLDNRNENLRFANKSQNGQNRKSAQKNSKSGVLGVNRNSIGNKWTASLRVNGKKITLGNFETVEEAEKIVKIGRAKYMENSKERKEINPSEYRLLDEVKNGPQGNNKSGYKYVNWDKNKNKWFVQMWVGKTKYHFGYFINVEDAARVANEKMVIYKS